MIVTEIDGSGYTRSGDGPAEWADVPPVVWDAAVSARSPLIITHAVYPDRVVGLPEPVQIGGRLTAAPGAVAVTLSGAKPRPARWRRTWLRVREVLDYIVREPFQ